MRGGLTDREMTARDRSAQRNFSNVRKLACRGAFALNAIAKRNAGMASLIQYGRTLS